MKPKPDPNLGWPIPLAAVELIADSEGLSLRAYRCPAGLPTIGWGQTEDIQLGMVWTKAQADEDLCRSLKARRRRWHSSQVGEQFASQPKANNNQLVVPLIFVSSCGQILALEVRNLLLRTAAYLMRWPIRLLR